VKKVVFSVLVLGLFSTNLFAWKVTNTYRSNNDLVYSIRCNDGRSKAVLKNYDDEARGAPSYRTTDKYGGIFTHNAYSLEEVAKYACSE